MSRAHEGISSEGGEKVYKSQGKKTTHEKTGVKELEMNSTCVR